MTSILIWGIGGKMGQTLARLVRNDETLTLLGGIDKFASPPDFKFRVFNDFRECGLKPQALIDFSRPEALDDILEFARPRRTPLVLCSTGYTPEDSQTISAYAKTAPVFRSANMSLGVSLLIELAKKAAAFLGDAFDVEIVEKHHNQKADSPSGTALMLADAVKSASGGEKEYVYGRHGKADKRTPQEIGIHAVRGGTIVGEHEVLFCGNQEVITLAHSAGSKEVFAAGAVAAAKFLQGKAPGLYSMADMLA